MKKIKINFGHFSKTHSQFEYMKDIVSVETIIWVQKTDQSKNQTVLEKIKWPCPGAVISMPNNVNSCPKKSTKRLKRPTSLIIQGQARSSVLKTQNNKLGKLKRIYQYLWTDFLSFPSPVSCCSYPLEVHSDGHIWSSRFLFRKIMFDIYCFGSLQ